MKRNGQITAFYLETLLLIVVFIAIILVLTQVFGLAQLQSGRAEHLTDAVVLAGNAAEAVSASGSREALLKLLDENGNAAELPNGNGVAATYDRSLNPDPAGDYRVEVSWETESAERGFLVRSVIRVFRLDGADPVYTLETASFKPEVAA